MKIDAERGNEFIVEDIDDETVLIKPRTEDRLKALLRDALKDTVREPEDSSSE
ncbi:TFIIH complex subunit tfb5 [Zalaria obscura]|uniref:TFIIH complex subunit tfb5 n=1 Tax=Zalaria obscura TaxID=2024903 RepID=A0ACC3SD25_9PEZI